MSRSIGAMPSRIGPISLSRLDFSTDRLSQTDGVFWPHCLQCVLGPLFRIERRSGWTRGRGRQLRVGFPVISQAAPLGGCFRSVRPAIGTRHAHGAFGNSFCNDSMRHANWELGRSWLTSKWRSRKTTTRILVEYARADRRAGRDYSREGQRQDLLVGSGSATAQWGVDPAWHGIVEQAVVDG